MQSIIATKQVPFILWKKKNKPEQGVQNFKKSRISSTDVATEPYFQERQSNTRNNVVCYTTKVQELHLKAVCSNNIEKTELGTVDVGGTVDLSSHRYCSSETAHINSITLTCWCQHIVGVLCCLYFEQENYPKADK